MGTPRLKRAPVKPILRGPQVAAAYRVTQQTLWRWRRDGYGPKWRRMEGVNGGSVIVYDEASVREWGYEYGYLDRRRANDGAAS